MEGKNQKMTKLGPDHGLLRREGQSLNFQIEVRSWRKKGHLKGIIIAGSEGMGWNGMRSNPGQLAGF